MVPASLPPPPQIESRRIGQLDGLRAVAILSVFIQHSLNPPLFWTGVDLFFVLSGFLITGILLERKAAGKPYFGHFYERRLRRIIPPYALVLAISSLLFGIAWTRQWYWYAFFGNNIVFAFGTVNDSLRPLWSIAVEEQFYLIWPTVVFFVSEKTLWKVAIAGIFLAPLLRGTATPFVTSQAIYGLTPFRMDLLCSGAALAMLWRKDPGAMKALRGGAWLAASAAATALLGLAHQFPQFRRTGNSIVGNTFLYSLVLIIVTSIVIIALANDPICNILRNPVLRYIGVISYSMYLIHYTVLVLVRQRFSNEYVVFIVGLGGTVLYATITWFGFEKRLLTHKRSAAGRSAQAASAGG
jgi:peptidoglycan/LPS O-acetylase OafA/YrhL